MKRSLLVCLLALPVMLTSCINQSEIKSLNARVTQNEQRMQQLSSQVGNVEQVLPGQAEMWAQVQAMRQELNTVRGQMDEMTAGNGTGHMAQLTAKVARLETAVRMMAAQMGVQVDVLDTPVAGETPPGAVPADGAAMAPGTAATPETAPTQTAGQTAPQTVPSAPQAANDQKDTATRLYDSGMNAFASRNYKGAVKAFTDFTKTYANHSLASNAHFWRGESYYQLKDYAGAALAYQDVIQKFPGSGKFQSAMLKQGMAFYYAGKKDAAKLRLEELVKKYPASPEAGRAKKFMEQNK
ncbi:Tol-pal system protein YbgF [uncultured delta proteobacterium]|uniref:Tol-pal system protein YbgF n=1 Tax=uncultured delta proteobacterium TaxID=34034 RepID=A0A212IWE8_9DELT|nr:Tol-pal system protein YbgF [uncultured delta proteobacterium]